MLEAANMSSPAVVGNAGTCIHRIHQSVLREFNSTFVYVQETFQFKVVFDPGSGFSALSIYWKSILLYVLQNSFQITVNCPSFVVISQLVCRWQGQCEGHTPLVLTARDATTCCWQQDTGQPRQQAVLHNLRLQAASPGRNFKSFSV